MENSKALVFEHKTEGRTPLSGWGATGFIIWIISFFSVFAGFIIFLVLAIKVNINYVWFADLLGILSLIFGPYALYIKRFYYFALTENNILIMKSAVSGIPRSYKVNLNSVKSITTSNPVKAIALEFKNEKGDLLGRFNPLPIKKQQFDEYLKIISERNKNIEIKI